jgi:hypothetical protein
VPSPGFSHAILSALLSHGADINAVDENGWTPAHLAAYHISTSICNLALLDFFMDSFGEGSAPPNMPAASSPSSLAALSMIDGIPCGTCGKSDDEGFLLCDHPTEPDHGHHMQCLSPQLKKVPKGQHAALLLCLSASLPLFPLSCALCFTLCSTPPLCAQVPMLTL